MRLASGLVTFRSSREGRETTHASSTAARAAISARGGGGNDRPTAISLDARRASHAVPIDAAAAYASIREVGLQYGPRFRPLHAIRGEETSVGGGGGGGGGGASRVSKFRVPRSCGVVASTAVVVDGAMQLSAPILPTSSYNSRRLRVPASVGAYASPGGGGRNGDGDAGRVYFCGGGGDDGDGDGDGAATDHGCEWDGGGGGGGGRSSATARLVELVSRPLPSIASSVTPAGMTSRSRGRLGGAAMRGVRYELHARAALVVRDADADAERETVRVRSLAASRRRGPVLAMLPAGNASVRAVAAAVAASHAPARWVATAGGPSDGSGLKFSARGAAIGACVRGVALSVALESPPHLFAENEDDENDDDDDAIRETTDRRREKRVVAANANVLLPSFPRVGRRPPTPAPQVRSIHWSPYDRVRVVNADP